MTGGPWSDDIVERMRRHADDGLSASAVAARIGRTRNAVLGMAWRLGVRFRGGPGGGPNHKPARRDGVAA